MRALRLLTAAVCCFFCCVSSLFSQSMGEALSFGGIRSYAQGKVEQLPMNNDSWTIEFWLKPSKVQSGIVVSFGNFDSVTKRAAIKLLNGKAAIECNGSNLVTNQNLQLSTWKHLAVTYNGTLVSFYLNGIKDAEMTMSVITSGDSLKLGAGFGKDSSNFLNGILDNVRIWKKSLTSCEILSRMNVNLKGNESDIVADYRFDQGLANSDNAGLTIAKNWAANGGNLELVGFALKGNQSNWVDNGVVEPNSTYQKPSISINIASGNSLKCSVDTIKIVSAKTFYAETGQFRWLRNGVEIPGATKQTYAATTLNDGDSLWLTYSGDVNCNAVSLKSNIVKIKSVQKKYIFNGSGDWSDSGQWLNRKVPPAIVPGCAEVLIDPVAGGICKQNVPVFFASGARLTVSGNKSLEANRDLTIADSILTTSDTTDNFFGSETDWEEFEKVPVIDTEDLLAPKLSASNSLSMPPVITQVGGTCTNAAIGYALFSYIQNKLEKNTSFDGDDKKGSPAFIHRNLVGNINEGSSIIDQLKFLRDNGNCKVADYPTYSDAAPSQTIINNARFHNNFALKWFRLSVYNPENIKLALNIGPVPIGVSIFNGFGIGCNPSYAEKKLMEITYSAASDGSGRKVLTWPLNYLQSIAYLGQQFAGNHSMLICDFDDKIQAFKVMNSWGACWGDNGYLWISYDALGQMIKKNPGTEEPEIYVVSYRMPDVSFTTMKAEAVTGSKATLKASAQSMGRALIFERGLVYSELENPSTANTLPANKTIGRELGQGDISGTVSGLIKGKRYYYRPFVKTDEGVTYGAEESFVAEDPAKFPCNTYFLGMDGINNKALWANSSLYGDFTLAAWIQLRDEKPVGKEMDIFHRAIFSFTNESVGLFLADDGTLRFRTNILKNEGGNILEVVNSGIIPTPFEWHHVAVTFLTTGICNIYYDGNLALTHNFNGSRAIYYPYMDFLAVGCKYVSGGGGFFGATYKGWIDEVVSAAKALSSDDIKLLMKGFQKGDTFLSDNVIMNYQKNDTYPSIVNSGIGSGNAGIQGQLYICPSPGGISGSQNSTKPLIINPEIILPK